MILLTVGKAAGCSTGRWCAPYKSRAYVAPMCSSSALPGSRTLWCNMPGKLGAQQILLVAQAVLHPIMPPVFRPSGWGEPEG